MLNGRYEQCIIKYICRKQCHNNIHIQKSYHRCFKCGYICTTCKKYSIYITYVYECEYCSKTFCLLHLNTHKEGIIHYCDKRSLVIYLPTSNTKQIITLDQEIYELADSISHQGKIYIIGGKNDGRVLGETCIVDLKKKTLIPKEKMLCPKYEHALCALKLFIYSVGGADLSRAFDDCEKYNIKNNSWSQLPALKYSRCYNAAFIFNYSVIYTFGGWSQNESNAILLEKLSIKNAIEWENVNVKNAPTMRNEIHGIQIGKNQILLFGSYQSSKECFLIDIKDDVLSFKKSFELQVGGHFHWCPAPILNGQYVYGVDEEHMIHICNLRTMKWRAIDK